MKIQIGDLVKHPAGVKNVCPDMYALGIVLQVQLPQNPPGEAHVGVAWHGRRGYLVYHESQLEVISESR